MKKNRIIIILSIVLAALIAVFAVINFWPDKNDNKSGQSTSVTQGTEITVKIIDKDKNVKTIEFETKKENLNDALFEKGLISKQEHIDGYYQTIDGIKTDYDADQSFWWLTVNGEDSMVGAKDIILKDGDVFEFIYKVG